VAKLRNRFSFNGTVGALVLVVAAGVSSATLAWQQPAGWPKIESPLIENTIHEQRIKELLARMSLEEKVGQIMQVEIQEISPEEVKKYHIGSVLNGGGSLPNRNKYAPPSEWLAMADAYYAASMDTSDGGVAIPIIWGSDAVHGHNNVIGATLFPHNIGLGAANNPGLVRRIGEATALEMRATGIDWTFAPTLAVVQNDRWGRTYESYSENPAIVKSFAGEMVEGLQGVPGSAEFLDVNHVVATAKHFVGDGGTTDGDDQGDAQVSEVELRDIHAAGYLSALKSGVQTAMASFSSWNGEKMHGSRYMLTNVLKEQMGFGGLVVGDWNGHGQVPGCTNASCPIAVNAGLDLFMTIQEWRELYANTLKQVKSGEIQVARLDDAVARILRVKFRAGLFEKGKPSDRGVAGKDGIIGRGDHRAIARQAVRESLVLLKNKGGLLPLSPKQRILIAGDGADNIGKQSGGWTISWQGTGNSNADFPGATSVYGGIRAAVEAEGGTVQLSVDGSYTVKPDAAVVVFGENPYAEGQGDIATLEYEAGDKRSLALLKSLKARGVPTVAVFLSGRPLWMNPEINAADAFVAAWLPGSEGAGVADVLIAKENGSANYDFQGRLSFSWPATPLQETLNPHHEGYAPQFAFGYGLTYDNDEAGPAMLAENVEGVQDGSASELMLFSGRTIAPWRLFISDSASSQVISGSYAALTTGSANAALVDKDIQGDAVRVQWELDTQASFWIGDGPGLDWTDKYQSKSVLQFDLKVDQALVAGISVSLGCGTDCRWAVDLSDQVRASAGQGWQTISLPLRCFAAGPENFAAISEPFRLSAIGKADMTVANIKLATHAGTDLQCPN